MEKKSPNDRIKKTRNRVPTSCEHCRRRKLKCDRQKPCGNCLKGQTEDLCKYVTPLQNTPNSLPRINLNNELIKLKLKINKLERILQINNIDISTYNSILPEVGDKSCKDELDENDPMVSLSDKFDAMIIKENKVLHSGTTSYITFIVHDKQLSSIFEAYSKKHLLIYESYQQRQKIKASDFPIDVAQNHLSWLTANANAEVGACEVDNMASLQFGPANGITNMQAKLVLDILDDVNKKLPPLYVVNVLVDHFFKFVYPLLPLVNEKIFKEELSYVLVPTQNGGCKVAITHLQNASIVSLLLVILRYGYLAVNINDYSEDKKAIGNDLLVAMIKSGYEIDPSYVVLAKSLLMSLPTDDSIFKKVTLRNVQVLTYLRLYQVYSPEMHEESREHSLTLALIIQMCRSLGANRDPTNFPTIFKDPREVTIWRRIFYKLLTLDVNNAFEYGCPLIISDEEYDVMLPTLEESDQQILADFKKGLSVHKSGDEIKNLVIENAINKDTALEYDAVKLIREGLNTFQNFKSSTKKSKLLEITDQLQEFIDNRIPSIWEMLQDNPSSLYNQLERLFDIPKVRRFEIRINVQTILMGFYYLLYLNEEQESDESNPSTGLSRGTGYDDIEGNNNAKYNNNNSLQSRYSVRATELALSIFKINYDYSKYMTQSVTLDGDSKQYKGMKFFSAKCDVFIMNRIAMSFLRPFLFLCSLFMKNLQNDVVTFDELFQKFSNTIDSTVVLKWLNINFVLKNDSDTPASKYFSFLVFQYTKDLFFMNYSLKKEYFVCWRNTMIIKLFINYFKTFYHNVCTEFLNPDFESSEEEVPSPGISTDPTTMNNSFDGCLDHESQSSLSDFTFNNNLKGNAGNYNGYFNDTKVRDLDDTKLAETFLDTAVPDGNAMNFENTGNDLDTLLYEDYDNMIEEIFKDNGDRQKVFDDFDIFKPKEMNALGEVFGKSGDFSPQEHNYLGSTFNKKIDGNTFNGKQPILESKFNSSNDVRSSTDTSISGFSGLTGAFTGMSSTSDGSIKTPDLCIFADSPGDFTKVGKKDSKEMGDIVADLRNKGLFY